MKMPTFILISGLAAIASLQAVSAWVVDLSPSMSKELLPINPSGISAETIQGYDIAPGMSHSEWQGTVENKALETQVKFDGSAGIVRLSIGAQSIGSGNFAAVRFELPKAPPSAPVVLSFDFQKDSQWGTGNFECEYSATVYGFNNLGEAFSIGTWKQEKAKSSIALGVLNSAEITLDLSSDSYVSYGLVFNSKKSLGSGGGMAMMISNLKVTSIPEPATATLGLLGLSALFLRRRRL